MCRSSPLPFELADAARSKEAQQSAGEDEMTGTVDQDTRLNVRYLDLRTAANQAIFRVQVRPAGACMTAGIRMRVIR